MRPRHSILGAALLLAAGCSTQADAPLPPRGPAAPAERIDAAWIARNGPSQAEREGWVQTGSGWYRSTEACLRYQEEVAAGMGALAGEGCLEPGI